MKITYTYEGVRKYIPENPSYIFAFDYSQSFFESNEMPIKIISPKNQLETLKEVMILYDKLIDGLEIVNSTFTVSVSIFRTRYKIRVLHELLF